MIGLCVNEIKRLENSYVDKLVDRKSLDFTSLRTSPEILIDRTKFFQKLESDIFKCIPDNFVMTTRDINAHVSCNDTDFIINEESDVIEDLLPSNYLIDNIHSLRYAAIHQVQNDADKVPTENTERIMQMWYYR